MIINHNGKQLNIPDVELKKLQSKLELSIEEAVGLYLDDMETTHEQCANAEAEALSQKAKSSGVQRNMTSVHGGKVGVKKKVNRPPDVDKIDLIKSIADWLETEGYDNINIINPSKLLEFDLGEDTYKLNLSRNRKKKN